MSRQRFELAFMDFARLLVRGLLAILGRLEIHGQENIPPHGPYMVVANHLSKTDSAIIMMALPRQRMHVFAAHKWRRNPLFGPILSLSGAIFVKRGQVDRKALRTATEVLQQGEILGMAPEGTRSKSGVLQKARRGAAYLASQAQVPLLPIGISDSDRFQDNLLHLRRTTFRVNIGPPFELPDLGHKPTIKELSALSELVMAYIANLLPERYHGHYEGSPVLAALREARDPWPAACQAAGLDIPASSDSPG
ncbi:MAG: 1-acyl-sn-glycerol-3-phosphate acyltransferase [Ardenticatenales bacterium]|nr:1-acyl-sn-glycerol-3-phosphate acyltransferase [Ardenticatenales bacterium]